ncbi:MAG: family transcriptional regulator [Sphingomonadales bacterium]|nr:family transcriptional regulator [Sphingomonadales bacterium]
MNWKAFVNETRGNDLQKDVAAKTGVNASTVSRWLSSGEPGTADNVIAFARAYKVEPLGALIAAGMLTEDEAKARPARRPDLTKFTNDELLELVHSRMQGGSGEHADSSATNTEAGESRPLRAVASGGDMTPEQMAEASLRAALAKAKQDVARLEMELRKRDKDG